VKLKAIAVNSDL